MIVGAEGFSGVVAGWAIANSYSLDKGDACGKVDDRTTSVTCFDQALERRDGTGFGNLMYSRVTYNGAGGIVDTETMAGSYPVR